MLREDDYGKAAARGFSTEMRASAYAKVSLNSGAKARIIADTGGTAGSRALPELLKADCRM